VGGDEQRPLMLGTAPGDETPRLPAIRGYVIVGNSNMSGTTNAAQGRRNEPCGGRTAASRDSSCPPTR
jgi:hypothetical protein